MKCRLLLLVAVAIAFGFAPFTVFAHHGVANFDETTLITLKGKVSEVDFRNPHVHIYFDVQGANGHIEKWTSESASPNILSREGWGKNAVMPGDQVVVVGHRAKDGSNLMLIEKLVLPNGRELNPRILSGG